MLSYFKQKLWSKGPPEPFGPPGLFLVSPFSNPSMDPVVLNHKLSLTLERGTLPVTGLSAESVQKTSFSPVFDQFCWIFHKLHRWTAARGSCCSRQSVDSCCTSCSPTDRMAVGRSPDMPRLVPNCSWGWGVGGDQILFISCLFPSP